jgi:hypothetical protein
MYNINGIYTVIFAIILQLLLLNLLREVREINNFRVVITPYEVIINDPSSTQEQITDATTEQNSFSEAYKVHFNSAYFYYTSFIYFLGITYCYFLKNILEVVFAYLRNKRIEINAEKILNFIAVVFAIYMQIAWYTSHNLKISSDDRTYDNFNKIISAFQDRFIKAQFGIGVIVAIQWLGVLFILRATKLFGPMIEIIINMIKKIVVFGIIFSFIFMIFLFVGCI